MIEQQAHLLVSIFAILQVENRGKIQKYQSMVWFTTIAYKIVSVIPRTEIKFLQTPFIPIYLSALKLNTRIKQKPAKEKLDKPSQHIQECNQHKGKQQ